MWRHIWIEMSGLYVFIFNLVEWSGLHLNFFWWIFANQRNEWPKKGKCSWISSARHSLLTNRLSDSFNTLSRWKLCILFVIYRILFESECREWTSYVLNTIWHIKPNGVQTSKKHKHFWVDYINVYLLLTTTTFTGNDSIHDVHSIWIYGIFNNNNVSKTYFEFEVELL